MSTRFPLHGLLAGIAGAVILFTPAQAQTCSGTLVLPSADETTSPGQVFGGDYLDTHASDDVGEAFNETLSNGVSRLVHYWRFDNVPAGAIHIIREGYRLTCDSDDFKFKAYYDSETGPYFIFGSFCAITSTTESTAKCSLNDTTDDAYTFHVSIVDSNVTSGTDLSAVRVDYLALCVEDVPCVPPPGGFCE